MKSTDRVLAKKYAAAYASLLQPQSLAAQAQTLKQIGMGISSVIIFQLPTLPKEQKKEILNAFVEKEDENTPYLKNLLYMLADNKKLHLLEAIAREVLSISDKQTNTQRVIVSTAKDISAAQKKEIETKLKEVLKADNIVADYKEDPALIGGFKAQTEEVVLDGSVKNNLEKLQQILEF